MATSNKKPAQKDKTPTKKPSREENAIFDAKIIITYQVVFKTTPECLNVWYEVIRHRYYSSIDRNRFNSTWEPRRGRAETLLCSTLKVDIANADQDDANGELLIIQIYHTNQRKPRERTIHIQGKCCVKWVQAELEHLKEIVKEIIRSGRTEPEQIHQTVENNMPPITLPDQPGDVAKAQPEVPTELLEKLNITPKKDGDKK